MYEFQNGYLEIVKRSSQINIVTKEKTKRPNAKCLISQKKEEKFTLLYRIRCRSDAAVESA